MVQQSIQDTNIQDSVPSETIIKQFQLATLTYILIISTSLISPYQLHYSAVSTQKKKKKIKDKKATQHKQPILYISLYVFIMIES